MGEELAAGGQLTHGQQLWRFSWLCWKQPAPLGSDLAVACLDIVTHEWTPPGDRCFDGRPKKRPRSSS